MGSLIIVKEQPYCQHVSHKAGKTT